MTLRLTEEQLEIRGMARDFALGEIRPNAAGWDARRELDPEIFKKLGELGFLGMRIPEAYGGLALDLTTFCQVLEELSWGDASVATAVIAHSCPIPYLLLKYGTDQQKERYLPAMASGEILGAFSLSEAGAGSDAGSIETRARKTDDGWVVNGSKKWVSAGERAGLILLFAKEEEGEGMLAFLLDKDTPGLTVGKREVMMGMAALDVVALELKDVEVRDDALVGEAGRGFSYALESLEVGRLGIASQAVGIGRAALEHARTYAKERVQFGKPLSDLQATRFKLARMATRLTAARALVHWGAQALEAAEEGRVAPEELYLGVVDPEAPSTGSLAAMAKVSASEAAIWITDEAVQIFGGYGYMRDYPVEKLLRDAKGTEIYEGTSEIMRLVIARDVLRSGPALYG
jgi:alkylation response protein AidB-like acyl-CoA dehydrogenase